MMGNSYEYLTGGYFMGDMECYTISYRTWKQTKGKFRFFTTLDEAVKWAKRQRGKIIPVAGSWQILKVLDGEPLEEPPLPETAQDAVPKYLMDR